MYLLRPLGKQQPYGSVNTSRGAPQLELPPWRGEIAPPVAPDRTGHFDHLIFGEPGFEEAHVFGSVRFVMDIWQSYAGQPIDWHFAEAFPRLEISILPGLNNAHAGYGYMEVGAYHTEDGGLLPYSLNFDVIAHETGHLVIYSLIGVPTPLTERGEYFGFHESAADLSALVAALHFDLHVDQLLETTHGNLYTFNELNRFAELSASDQIRLASNTLTMEDFAKGWTDEHALSQPLTGAFFDIFIDIFQEHLVDRGIIPRRIADLTRLVARRPDIVAAIQPAFDDAYRQAPEAFRGALLAARDYLGFALAETWKRLSPGFFSYAKVAETLLGVEAAISRGRYRHAMLESFDWRGVGRVASGPRRAPPGPDSHSQSVRTLIPDFGRRDRPTQGLRPRFSNCRCDMHRNFKGGVYG
ncbi:hypothetical protein [Lichenifustis flavocetrariae]|uniref:Uncharacterized protein n=1 Tax=Lichenifustis flavocetrariae TaxID=2949735 RepID=A0AA42CIE7_9HYPH|nr:hypothetical protein [Lichenifustis flavocetrariae]MCW6506781.1 hypothetical protein [Lichenifustis flavocetrariae]